MKKYIFLSFFLLMACAAGHRIMTTETFYEVNEGMTEKELKAKAGTPYLIKDLGNGEKQYEYIERVIINNRTVEARRYLFIIKNGIVTSKKIVYDDKDKPLLERNAYDLQTSLKGKDF